MRTQDCHDCACKFCIQAPPVDIGNSHPEFSELTRRPRILESMHAIRLICTDFSLLFPRGYGTNSGDAINSQRLNTFLLGSGTNTTRAGVDCECVDFPGTRISQILGNPMNSRIPTAVRVLVGTYRTSTFLEGRSAPYCFVLIYNSTFLEGR